MLEMDMATAREIVMSAHESAHAVASVRLGLRFEYVTLDDSAIGPHVQSINNAPRPIPFYRGGGCCGPLRPPCLSCLTEEERAESLIVMAICGSLGVAIAGTNAFGYGEGADKVYVVECCKIAFGDSTVEGINERMANMLRHASKLMDAENKTVTAVAKALRERRRLSESEVKELIQDASS